MLFVITALENAAVCAVVMPVSPTGSTAPRNLPGTSPTAAPVSLIDQAIVSAAGTTSSAIASARASGRSRTRTQYVRAKNVRSEPRRGSSAYTAWRARATSDSSRATIGSPG